MKENTVWLHGQVYGTPKIIVNSERLPIKVRLVLKVMRRFGTLSGMEEDNIRIDHIIIATDEPSIIKYCEDNVREGDMVDIKGVYTTRYKKKKRICPHCNAANIMLGVENVITPQYICVREKGLTDMKAFELLRERNEISNYVLVLGTIISNIDYYEDEKQRYSQYCIKLGRKYWIKSDPDELRDDFPHVKSYGIQGERDRDNLSLKDNVLINGSLSARTFKRHKDCDVCGSDFEFEDSTMEIHSYSVEYLNRHDEEESQ